MKKVKLFAFVGLTTLLAVGAVAAVGAARGSSMMFAEGCEHEGNHYAATASLDAAGNKEYWVCCKCHEHFFVEPTGNWEVQVLEETLAPTDDRYIAPQRDYVERMAALPTTTEYNPNLKAKKDADFLTAYYETLPEVAKALYSEATVAKANAYKAVADTMHIGGSIYQWNKSHWFYNVDTITPTGAAKADVAVPQTDEVYGNYIRANIGKDLGTYGNILYGSTVIGNNAEERLEARNRQAMVDDNSVAGIFMVRASKPGNYVIQTGGASGKVDTSIKVTKADTWESFTLSNLAVKGIKSLTDGTYFSVKTASTAVEAGNYFDITDVIGITEPAEGCTKTYAASNSWGNGDAFGSKVNNYAGGGQAASLLTNVDTSSDTTKLVDYSYKVVDATKLASSSISFLSDELIAETGTVNKFVFPIYVSESMKIQIKEHVNYTSIVNETLPAGWNFVECTNVSAIATTIEKQDKTLLYYASGCHNGALIYIGAPRAAVTPAAAA